MMEPHPLNNGHDVPLASPEFRSEPGWGGQLTDWYKNNGRTVLVRLLILVALPVALAPFFNRTTKPLDTPALESSANRPTITVTIESGDGLIHGARLALYEYLALQPIPLALAPEQYVFAEDWIVRRMTPYVPAPGETLEFPYEVLSAAVLKAQSLTPQERASWLRYTQ